MNLYLFKNGWEWAFVKNVWFQFVLFALQPVTGVIFIRLGMARNDWDWTYICVGMDFYEEFIIPVGKICKQWQV